jgi:hypothetical protein
LCLNTVGIANTSVGNYSSYGNINGDYNTAVGFLALFVDWIHLDHGNYNTAIGYNAGPYNNYLTNTIAIGYNAKIGASNQILLGNSSIAQFYYYGAFSSLSDSRDKKNITPIKAGLQFINELKPVDFIWNMRDGGKVDIPECGFIAQELAEAQVLTGITIPNLVDTIDPEKLHASYGTLIPVLVKAIQELSSKVTRLEMELNEIKKQSI